MPDYEENANEEKKIESQKGMLGNAQRLDPNAPREETFMSKEALNARQRAIGEKRKTPGPLLHQEHRSERASASSSDVKPTDCKEPDDIDPKLP